MTRVVAGIAVFALGLAFAALATATPAKNSYKLNANLKARFEVPKPRGVRVGASGAFTGTVVELSNDKAKLSWRLTFSKLSGRAIAAHIHVGKVGKSGAVLVALCGPCTNGQRGSARISHAQLRTIRAGRSYVNLHTPKNPAGEIRGQVKFSGTSSSDDSGTDTTTTTSEPPPYP